MASNENFPGVIKLEFRSNYLYIVFHLALSVSLLWYTLTFSFHVQNVPNLCQDLSLNSLFQICSVEEACLSYTDAVQFTSPDQTPLKSINVHIST